MAHEGPTPESLFFPTMEAYLAYAADNPDVYADADSAQPTAEEVAQFPQLDGRRPLGDIATMHAALLIASVAAEEPEGATSLVHAGAAQTWDEFWGDGRVTEVDMRPVGRVPRERQPSSHFRLGGSPLGCVAIRRSPIGMAAY